MGRRQGLNSGHRPVVPPEPDIDEDWTVEDRNAVRRHIGHGHVVFTDEQIDAAARSLAFPTTRRVALRLGQEKGAP